MDFLLTIIALIGAFVLAREARRDVREGVVELNLPLLLLALSFCCRLWQAQWASLALAGAWLAIFALLTLLGGAGSGDGPLVAFVCLALPFFWGLASVLLAFIIGGVYGLWGLATGRLSRRQAVPFVPFLAFGYWISLITWSVM